MVRIKLPVAGSYTAFVGVNFWILEVPTLTVNVSVVLERIGNHCPLTGSVNLGYVWLL